MDSPDFGSVRAPTLALLAALCACRPDLALPDSAQVSCESSTDCVDDWVCDKGRCVSPETLATARRCQTAAECDDGVFCNGTERCESGFCLSPPAPCTSSFECVVTTCHELGGGAGACDVRPDHSRCSEGEYCNPDNGCIPGLPCLEDAECQDGAACNGREVCSGFQCVPGPPVVPNDGNTCTLDVCAEPDGPRYLPIADLKGEVCYLDDEGAGAPLRVCGGDGQCVPSICGDRMVDVRTEQCDDGNSDPNDGCDGCRATQWVPGIVTGLGRHGGDPKKLTLYSPAQLAVGADGAIYAPDYLGDRVWHFADGLAFVAAGSGSTGLAGDGGPAAAARLNGPISVAVDGEGNLYVADYVNDRIRRVDATSRAITTFAGGGASGDEDAPAVATRLTGPADLVVDGLGNLYFVDLGTAAVGDERLRRIDARTQRVRTVAGDPFASSDGDGTALAVRLRDPLSLALDGSRALYVGEPARIRRLDLATGQLTTVIGNGSPVSVGDGVPAAEAGVASPVAMAVDAAGDLYFCDQELHAIRRVRFGAAPQNGAVVETVAGDGTAELPRDGFALASPLPDPQGIAFAPDGSMVIGEYRSGSVLRVSRPTPDPKDWTLTRLAGGLDDLEIIAASPATTVRLWTNNLATRGDQVYFTDIDRHVIWKVDLTNPDDALTWRLRVVAGAGDSSAEGVPATESALDLGDQEGPLVFGPDDALYVGVTGEYRIRRISPEGIIETVAGSGEPGDSGDGGPALQARLAVTALAFDVRGRLFVVGGGRVRVVTRVDPEDPTTWTIDAAFGTGVPGSGGDGGPAAEATLGNLWGVATSPEHVFVSETDSSVIRASTITGEPAGWTALRAAGNGTAGFAGDDGPALSASFDFPAGIDWDPATQSLLVADRFNDAVRRVTVSGPDPSAWTVTSIHDPTPTTNPFYGDGGPVSAARFYRPRELALSDGGVLYVGMFDTLRRVDPATGMVTTILGGADPAGDGSLGAGGLGTPRALSRIDEAHLAVADGGNGRVRWVDLARDEVRTVAGYPGGSPATGAVRYSRLLEEASGIAWTGWDAGGEGSLFVSEERGHSLRRLKLKRAQLEQPWLWEIEDFAGLAGQPGHADGPLAASRFFGPSGLAFDSASRTLYVAESLGQVVRAIRVDETESPGCVTTVAGVPGRLGFRDGEADEALFHGPTALALDGGNGLYVADTQNHRVRRIDLETGDVLTVLGTGRPGSSGIGAPATSYPVDAPGGLAVDAHGNLFVSSRDSVREVTRSQLGSVASGQGRVLTLYGPSSPASLGALTQCFSGLLLDGDGSLFALDQCQGVLLRFARQE